MRKIYITLFLFIALNITDIYAEEIVIVSDIWCPYTCEDIEENQGYLVDIIRAVFAQRNINVTYKSIPWQKSISGVYNGEYDAIIATTKAETPALIFPEYKLETSSSSFFTLSNNSWTFEGIKSLSSITLGLINNYGYSEILQKYIVENSEDIAKLFFADDENELEPIEQTLKRLKEKRIDAIYADEKVVSYYSYKLNIPMIREATNKRLEIDPNSDFLYIAFSPQNPKSDTYADIFDEEFPKLIKNDKFQEILSKYGL